MRCEMMEAKEAKETMAEILAEYRADADKMDCDELYQPTTIYIRQLLNRIEAAWEREAKAIATENAVLPAVCITKSVGNAAAMREALEFLRDKELYLLEGNVRHCIGLTVFGLEQTCKIMRGVIEEALSEPPRNCDRFNNEREMQFAFLAELLSIGINGASLEEYSKWLLAKAKGASNESK